MVQQAMISTMDTLALLECLKAHQLSDDEIMAATGVQTTIMDSLDFEIPIENLLKLWKKAAEVTGDPAIGIHLRQHYGGQYIHFVNYISMNSRNVVEALQHIIKYGKLFSNIFSYDLRQENDQFVFSFSINSPAYQNPWIPEYHLSLYVYLVKLLGIQFTKVEAVHFQYPCRGDVQVYTDFFNAPVYFEQSENAVVFSKEMGNLEIPGHNPHLQKILKKQAETALTQLTREDGFAKKVEELIIKNLGSGNLDIEMAAMAMNMHRSTLHRKLKQNGTSFNTLVTRIRRNLAKLYLEQGMSIDQISYLLGYANRSAFTVAFKSWFGKPPGLFK